MMGPSDFLFGFVEYSSALIFWFGCQGREGKEEGDVGQGKAE